MAPIKIGMPPRERFASIFHVEINLPLTLPKADGANGSLEQFRPEVAKSAFWWKR
ncbi:hypothetical protein [Mesorhizobium sp. WSM4887]|uniref:hypothetical protein n=1 Tax=Mesorhizobium sp. WSM4887 TaxID=3038543 RepID=UPI002417A6EB|nr:hypothetical protein [Mesorhizobium sp. WSM4887]MDG4888735.1 hypothetical protein [Mesorhizobium sp. WSM4887]